MNQPLPPQRRRDPATRFALPKQDTNRPTVHPPQERNDRQRPPAAMTMRCLLVTAWARQCYRRDFLHFHRQLHKLNACRLHQTVSPEALVRSESRLALQLQAVACWLGETRQETERGLSRNRPAAASLRLRLAMPLQAPVVHPLSRQYLQVLMAADQALALVHKQWLLGLMDGTQCHAKEIFFDTALRSVLTLAQRCHEDAVRETRLRYPGRATPGQPAVDLVLGQRPGLHREPALGLGRDTPVDVHGNDGVGVGNAEPNPPGRAN